MSQSAIQEFQGRGCLAVEREMPAADQHMEVRSESPMRIAQVAPLYESVPPALYGGSERVVSYLTEELVRQGHDVTLFASGDSVTKARLISPCPRALRLDPDCPDPLAYHIIMLDQAYHHAQNFDVIHYHIDFMHFPFSRRNHVPHVTTLHGRLDLPNVASVYWQFPDIPVISISDSQRDPLPWANWVATVYHGVTKHLYWFQETPGSYLAFIGRISPEKGIDRAIDAAIRIGMPLRIAAKVDKADREYFETHIKARLGHPLIEFVGEIGEHEKREFLGGAYALLFLIDWPEPFGMAMIESLACGTPVIAFRRGSVPEVIDDGVTGFVVDEVDGAIEAIEKVGRLNRRDCRSATETLFSDSRMARDYLSQYSRLQNGKLSAAGSHAEYR